MATPDGYVSDWTQCPVVAVTRAPSRASRIPFGMSTRAWSARRQPVIRMRWSAC